MRANHFVVFVGTTLFSILTLAADPFGTFATVKGDVKVDKDGKKAPAKVAEKVFQGSTVETGADGRAKILMSDRSVVHVSPDSKVKIAVYSAAEAGKNVQLELSKGKVRNEVNGTYDGKNKYEVKTPTAVAGVRGTDFLVNHDVKTNTTEVITFKGTVEFTAMKNGAPTGSPVLIKQNEKASAGASATVEPPKTIAPEEKKQLESDTKANDSAPAKDGGSAPAPKNDGKKKDGAKTDGAKPGADTGSAPAAGGKAKIGDTRDTAPESFDQVPKTGTAPTTAPLPATNPNAFIPKGPNTRTNDAIRDKTDKTTVIVKPQGR